jgi:excisionase family DNA binding protein
MENVPTLAVSPAQAARLLSISRSAFYKLVGDQLPLLKVGRRTLVRVSDIEKYLDSLSRGGERP